MSNTVDDGDWDGYFFTMNSAASDHPILCRMTNGGQVILDDGEIFDALQENQKIFEKLLDEHIKYDVLNADIILDECESND